MLGILARCLQVLLAMAVVVAGFGWFRFGQRAGRHFEVTAEPITAATSPTDIVRGEHLARSIGGCAHCHGDDLGGRLVKQNAMLRLAAPNITSGEGGVVAGYADADWVRAILHGVARDGRPLLIMPATELRGLSDDDVAAILGYVKQVPPVARHVPSAKVKLPGQVLAGLVSLPWFPAEEIDHRAGAPPRLPAGRTARTGSTSRISAAGATARTSAAASATTRTSPPRPTSPRRGWRGGATRRSRPPCGRASDATARS